MGVLKRVTQCLYNIYLANKVIWKYSYKRYILPIKETIDHIHSKQKSK